VATDTVTPTVSQAGELTTTLSSTLNDGSAQAVTALANVQSQLDTQALVTEQNQIVEQTAALTQTLVRSQVSEQVSQTLNHSVQGEVADQVTLAVSQSVQNVIETGIGL